MLIGYAEQDSIILRLLDYCRVMRTYRIHDPVNKFVIRNKFIVYMHIVSDILIK